MVYRLFRKSVAAEFIHMNCLSCYEMKVVTTKPSLNSGVQRFMTALNLLDKDTESP